MSLSKTLSKKAYLALPVTVRKRSRFCLNTGYFQSLQHPLMLNKKPLYRKFQWTNPLFSIGAGKIDSKTFATGRRVDLVVLEKLAKGVEISFGVLKKTVTGHGDIVLKTSHDTGARFALNAESNGQDLMNACKAVNKRCSWRFCQLQCRGWYSHITSGFLIEKEHEAPRL